jgi:hypothetical protein
LVEEVPGSPVAYNDLKEFRGKVYSGMPIGGTHVWEYPHGVWQEHKVAPDRWVFSFLSEKKRARRAPEGSGALPGTRYHWFILAHQRVRKIDQDTYETVMEGVKYKVAHKRPHWRAWSTEYPDHEPERAILIRILEEQLAELKGANAPQESNEGLQRMMERSPVPENGSAGLLSRNRSPLSRPGPTDPF